MTASLERILGDRGLAGTAESGGPGKEEK